MRRGPRKYFWPTLIFIARITIYNSASPSSSPPALSFHSLKGLQQLQSETEREQESEREMLVLVGLGRLWQAAAEPKFTVKTHVTYFSRNYGKREKFR